MCRIVGQDRHLNAAIRHLPAADHQNLCWSVRSVEMTTPEDYERGRVVQPFTAIYPPGAGRQPEVAVIICGDAPTQKDSSGFVVGVETVDCIFLRRAQLPGSLLGDLGAEAYKLSLLTPLKDLIASLRW
jgi:hypothetical protein